MVGNCSEKRNPKNCRLNGLAIWANEIRKTSLNFKKEDRHWGNRYPHYREASHGYGIGHEERRCQGRISSRDLSGKTTARGGYQEFKIIQSQQT